MGLSKAGGSKVEVRIDELVLDGFPPTDQFGIAEGVKHELARLIREQGLGRRAGQPATAAVDTGSFQVAPGADPRVIGRQVAQSVHRELMGRRGRR